MKPGARPVLRLRFRFSALAGCNRIVAWVRDQCGPVGGVPLASRPPATMPRNYLADCRRHVLLLLPHTSGGASENTQQREGATSAVKFGGSM